MSEEQRDTRLDLRHTIRKKSELQLELRNGGCGQISEVELAGHVARDSISPLGPAPRRPLLVLDDPEEVRGL